METEDKKRQARYIILSSMIILCASLIIFILILVNQLGYFNVSSARDNPFVRPRTSILLSDYNYSYYGARSVYYQEMIDQWYQLLKEQGIKPRVIKDKELEAGIKETDILIMPSSACLSNDQINSVKEFVSKGGGLIFSWAAGSRREGGSWRGWEFVEELSGVKIVKIDEKDPLRINYVALGSDSPVTAGIPSGLRVEIRRDEAEIFARSDSYDAFYSEWQLYPAGAEKGYPPFTAIAHNSYGKGKVLWFSFNTNRLLAESSNKQVLYRVADNAINWMLGYPTGSIDNWPGARRGAFFVDQDTEHEPQNAAELARIVSEEKGAATFFCISSIFEKQPEILKGLGAGIEIGSHLDTAETLNGQTYEKQLARLKASKESLERITGKKVLGMKPAEEIYDSNTIRALMTLGYTYMIGNPRSPVAVPAIISQESIPKDIVRLDHIMNPPESNFVVIPRLARDDYLLMATEKIMDKDKLLAIMKADFLNIYNLGGLYIMPVHTQLLSSPSHSSVIRDLLRFASQYDIWLAPGRDVAEWWLTRGKLEHRITSFDSSGFSSTLASKNGGEVRDIGLTYHLSRNYGNVTAEADEAGAIKSAVFDANKQTLRLILNKIGPSEKIKIKIRFF